ncbi:hypothetical protein CMV_024210 [Castanea mollissima]|uniref:DUF629 domain-containing protein n=1 Tax=Castanea mollissima TaxID=60419 RepID=A0A8J4QNG9_9ROSI|nr:hypothetical protein CMV_024210 [Castanea mollissima]
MSRRDDAPSSPSPSPSQPPPSKDDDDQLSTITKEINHAIRLLHSDPTEALNLFTSILSRHPNPTLTQANAVCNLVESGLQDQINASENVLASRQYYRESLREELRTLKAQKKKILYAKSMADIKNDIQEQQNRKKEIEERVNTARMNFKMPEDDKRKLRKHASKVVDKVTTRVEAYWKDTMSMERKKELLRIRIKDLTLHFVKDIKSPVAEAAVMEAVDQRFFDVKSNAEHIKSTHLGTFPDELSVESEVVFDSVHDTVESRKWRPVDVAAAVKMMEDLSRNERGDDGLDESKVFMNQKEWPYCEDSRPFMDLTMEMLKKRISEQLLKKHWMNRTLLSACFLDIPELNRVSKFLDDLDSICGLQCLCESLEKDEARGESCVDNHEKIVFNEDFSCVVFDKRMLRGELVVQNDGAAVTSIADDEIVLNDDECKDAIVDWLMKGGTNISIGEQLKQWTYFRETSRSQAMEFFKIYEAEFHRMQSICEKKIGCLRDIKLWKNLETICIEEDKRRKQFSAYKPLSYKYLLLKRRREIERTNYDTSESDMILDLLREEQVEDNKIKLVITNQINEMDEKLYKFDAIIRTTSIAMQQTGKKIDSVTAYDHRSIMVPLLKSLMRARLEDMAYEDAEKKSNAASEALLSALVLSDKKGTHKGVGGARQGQGKSKTKKKKKDHRKTEESKAAGGSEELQENVQQISFPAAHDGDDCPNPEIVDPVTTDELEQQERKLTSEEEKEQRMLKEHLEYQRQIENEAKQKRLAELNKAGSSAGNM